MNSFAEIELIAPLQRALADENYVTPTPIQAQTIPPALDGRDILGCAQTGTGKTAAFALPILNHFGKQNRKAPANRPFALVLAPTRELAVQIGESFATYGRHLRLRQAVVYGGVSQRGQVRALSRGVHILVATPGRLLDLINQGFIELDRLEVFVLDEADRMLDMGFLPDLKRIISRLPKERQSLFFSATLPPKIVELSESLLNNPVDVNISPESTSVERIEQKVIVVQRSGKHALLQKTLSGEGVARALVFTKTKRMANTLSERLVKDGIKATAIHGNKSQAARQKALEALRKNRVQVLVATDVAARGIDIDGITHVVNYDLPFDPESYVHRIGRTGRAGAEGIAVSFCEVSERRELRAIEKYIGRKLEIEGELGSSGEERPGGSRKPRRRSNGSSYRPKTSGSKKPGRRFENAEISSAESKPKRRRRPKSKKPNRAPLETQSV